MSAPATARETLTRLRRDLGLVLGDVSRLIGLAVLHLRHDHEPPPRDLTSWVWPQR